MLLFKFEKAIITGENYTIFFQLLAKNFPGNLLLKKRLGDFRLQSFEAIERWFAVVTLAMNYLQYEQIQTYLSTHQLVPLAELIRRHRLSHFQALLRKEIGEAIRTGQVEEVIEQFMPFANWAVT